MSETSPADDSVCGNRKVVEAGLMEPVARASETDTGSLLEHELPWWRKYVFSTDHKVIGIQYAISGLIFNK